MAAAIAGVKRSYHDMTTASPSSLHVSADHVSLVPSPLQASSRTSSQAPEFDDAATSASLNTPLQKLNFEPSASIVLLGVRGVGKSTLGILAANAYSRRVIESERAFVDAAGSTTKVYRKAHGSRQYLKQHNQILESTLKRNNVGAVIICTFEDLEGTGAKIIRDYARSHPVVYITRDAEGIRSAFASWSGERLQGLLDTSATLLRSCSNCEFFNLTDNENGNAQNSERNFLLDNGRADLAESFLTLKSVERDFLRFLRNKIGDHERGRSHHSAYPFSRIAVESRKYTFAVQITLSQVLNGELSLEEAQIGADCVELRMDSESNLRKDCFSDVSKAFAVVRRSTILPIILTINQSMLSAATTAFGLRLGPEFCTVDLSVDEVQLQTIITSKGYSKIIGSLQMDSRPSQGWNDQAIRDKCTHAASIGCDVVKITMPADTIDDTIHVDTSPFHANRTDSGPRLIAYDTGSKGRTSQCFNEILTSVAPYCPVQKIDNDVRASCQLSAVSITRARFAAFLFEPLSFSIFGGDVSYSLSPAIHNAAYRACGMDHSYQPVSSRDIVVLKTLTQSYDFGGTAITQPFKTTALSMLDSMSSHAKAIGAVNTVIPLRQLMPDGGIPDEIDIITQRHQQGPVKALYGFNTDWIGIRACIRKGLSPANAIKSHTTAIVCGAGGMGRSAVYCLLSLGVRHIFIWNRTLSTATSVAKHYNELVSNGQISELSLENASHTKVEVLESFQSSLPSNARAPTIIICCVPRRTDDDAPTNFALPESWLKSLSGGVVVEVAYRQPLSPLAHQVKSRAKAGWIFMDGYDVLPEQAYSQFELFTGRRAPRKLMRDVVQKHILDNELGSR